MTAGLALRCPVCRARFRGAAICPRCAADLAPVMRLIGAAWQQRRAARRALEAGDLLAATAAAGAAQRDHATPHGAQLACVIALMARAT